MNIQEIFNIIVGMLATFFFWGLKENYRTLERLKKKDGELTLQIAERYSELNGQIAEKYAELNHKLTGKDKFIMAHYALKTEVEKEISKILSQIDKRLDKSDILLEKLNQKIDELKDRK